MNTNTGNTDPGREREQKGQELVSLVRLIIMVTIRILGLHGCRNGLNINNLGILDLLYTTKINCYIQNYADLRAFVISAKCRFWQP